MQKLVRGVDKFKREVYVPNKQLYAKLAEGQSPSTLFITCSDSRINPNTLTQTEPGEVFILRNAGNIVPAHGSSTSGGEAATIEYAVSALGVTDIVICGHSLCGAMKGLLDPSSLESLPAVRAWLAHAESTRSILRSNYADREGDALLNVAIQENVLVQLQNLQTLPSVAARLAGGTLNLHGWVYKFETGDVFAYDGEAGQFGKIGERSVALRGVRRSFAPTGV
jgi:carbonic anhydrase